MSDRVLHLNLKGCYFDAIRDGSKSTEYRLADKWESRLTAKTFTAVHLMRGYPRRDATEHHLLRAWQGFTIETIQHPHFGPAPVRVCAIDVSKPYEPTQKPVPNPSPNQMTTTETPPNPDLRTGSIPVRATIENKAGVDSPQFAPVEQSFASAWQKEFSPQSSPKPRVTEVERKAVALLFGYLEDERRHCEDGGNPSPDHIWHQCVIVRDLLARLMGEELRRHE